MKTAIKAVNVIARKPRIRATENSGLAVEYIIVDRGEGSRPRFVSATATEQSLASDEWFLGHYFNTFKEALIHFNGRV